jgi:hypothetical protein
MSAIIRVLLDLYTAERQLTTELLDVGERHKVEHDVYHITRELASWSEDHVSCLAAAIKDRGEDVSSDPALTGLVPALRQWAADNETSDPGLLLLQDLQVVYLTASYASLCWEILAQGAQALKVGTLLELSSTCHPQTLRQLRWANTKLKESAPQTLSSES